MWQWSAEGRNTSLDSCQHAGREKDCWGKVSVSVHLHCSVHWMFARHKAAGRRWGRWEMKGISRLPVATHDKSLWREWDSRYGGGGSPGRSGSFINWTFALKERKRVGEQLRAAHLRSSWMEPPNLHCSFFSLPAATLFLCKDDCPRGTETGRHIPLPQTWV